MTAPNPMHPMQESPADEAAWEAAIAADSAILDAMALEALDTLGQTPADADDEETWTVSTPVNPVASPSGSR